MKAAALGDPRRLAGYALAGAEVAPVEEFESLDEEVGLLVLTPEAYDELADRLDERPGLVWAVLP